MKILYQLLLSLILIMLSIGLVGHHVSLISGGPDPIMIGLWATTWFLGLNTAIWLAIFCGVQLDLVMFTPFGLWTALFCLIVVALDFSRSRFFSVSSLLHALLALGTISALGQVALSIITGQFDPLMSLVVILSNLLLGGFIYYAAAMRWKLFAWWSGGRL